MKHSLTSRGHSSSAERPADGANPGIVCVCHIENVVRSQRQRGRVLQLRLGCGSAVSRETGAGARDGRDDAREGVDPANPAVERVRDDQVPCGIGEDSSWSCEPGFGCGPVVQGKPREASRMISRVALIEGESSSPSSSL